MKRWISLVVSIPYLAEARRRIKTASRRAAMGHPGQQTIQAENRAMAEAWRPARGGGWLEGNGPDRSPSREQNEFRITVAFSFPAHGIS